MPALQEISFNIERSFQIKKAQRRKMSNGWLSNPTVACTTTSVERCAKPSVCREADFVPDF